MNAPTVSSLLNQVLRNHLTMSSQLFLHDLIAREWRQSDIKNRYGAEYGPDISRLFALLEHMLALDYSIRTTDSRPLYSEFVPRVGRTLSQMLERDHALLMSVQAMMQTGIATCEHSGDPIAAEILREAVRTRANFLTWVNKKHQSITSSSNNAQCLTKPVEPQELAAWGQINRLVTRVLALIDQTVCHTVVLTHADNEAKALSTWRMSWLSMIHLGAVVSALAAKGWAIEPSHILRAHPSIKPSISEASDEAIVFDANLYTLAAKDAEGSVSSTVRLGDTELERVVSELRDTLNTCATGVVPKAAMAYSILPQRSTKWSYANLPYPSRR